MSAEDAAANAAGVPSAGRDVNRLNWLRAGVLGANDGIVSVAAVSIGVAGATSSTVTILLAGLAALLGGAISMGLGEYVSVSTQLDSQRAAKVPHAQLVSPWHAAIVSFFTFVVGAVPPLLAVALLPDVVRIPLTAVLVLTLLGFTGATGARLGGSRMMRPTIRVVLGGAVALAATYAIGTLLGTSGL